MIPSEEIRINMYPMDFEEFLWAMDEEAIMQLIKTNMPNSSLLAPTCTARL